MRRRPIIALSGGFDPLHVGHVRMIEQAQAYGDVVVILNSDKWLLRKKGFVFMTWDQRCEILDALSSIHLVLGVDDRDDTVCQALKSLRPDYFGNGGDRTSYNTPEADLCKKLDVEEIYNLGGGKVQSSSRLVFRAVDDVLTDDLDAGFDDTPDFIGDDEDEDEDEEISPLFTSSFDEDVTLKGFSNMTVMVTGSMGNL